MRTVRTASIGRLQELLGATLSSLSVKPTRQPYKAAERRHTLILSAGTRPTRAVRFSSYSYRLYIGTRPTRTVYI